MRSPEPILIVPSLPQNPRTAQPPPTTPGSMTRWSAPMVGRALVRSSPSSIGRWHAARWPGPSPSRGSGSGTGSAHDWGALGARRWNLDPAGGVSGDGTSTPREDPAPASAGHWEGTGTPYASAPVDGV